MSTKSTTTAHHLHTNPFVSLHDAMDSMQRKLDKWLDETSRKHPGFAITSQSHAVHQDRRGHVISTILIIDIAE